MAKSKFLKNTWKRMMPVVIPPVGAAFLRTIWLTMGKRAYGLGAIREEMDAGRGVIIAFWHGRMLLLPPFYQRFLYREGYVLVSEHRDGELISRTISRFDIDSIRGSSSHGGREALEEMIVKFRGGAIVAITPDGPRGPGEKARRGVIELAHLTGASIYPLTYAASRQKKLNSWDRFVIPAPFSKVVFVFGAPIRVKSDEGLEGRERLRLDLERRLIELGLEAERLAGWKPKGVPPLASQAVPPLG